MPADLRQGPVTSCSPARVVAETQAPSVNGKRRVDGTDLFVDQVVVKGVLEVPDLIAAIEAAHIGVVVAEQVFGGLGEKILDAIPGLVELPVGLHFLQHIAHFGVSRHVSQKVIVAGSLLPHKAWLEFQVWIELVRRTGTGLGISSQTNATLSECEHNVWLPKPSMWRKTGGMRRSQHWQVTRCGSQRLPPRKGCGCESRNRLGELGNLARKCLRVIQLASSRYTANNPSSSTQWRTALKRLRNASAMNSSGAYL